MRQIKDIVIHCSATKEDRFFDVNDIDSWHKQRGFRCVGYHYVILLDGTIQKGREEKEQGAHVKGHNKHSIGVCYIGGLDDNGKPKDTRTKEQKKALEVLLCDLLCKYPKAKLSGHRDFSKDLNDNGVIEQFEFIKACPCFDVKKEYSYLL